MYSTAEFLFLAQALEVYHVRSGHFSSHLLPPKEHKKKVDEILKTVPAEHVDWVRRKLAASADDNFGNKDWPVCAVINDRWFRGALVILAERSRDPAGPPLQGDTFLDGLTEAECKEASPYIKRCV